MVLINEIPEKPPTVRKVTFKDEPLAMKTNGKALILPLVVLHATLVALVRYQYGQEVDVKLVIKESWLSVPIFWGLFEYVHPHLVTRRGQLALCAASTVGACHLIYIANELGYYAVMYRAPPVGSLVVWGFIELNLLWSLLAVVVAGFYLWLKGYHM